MATAWDRARELTEQHMGASSVFIRLANDGDRIVGAFCGEPYAREVHWSEERHEECAGDHCPHCALGLRPSVRVAINFWVTEEGTVKVLEGGATWFRDVLAVRDKYGLDAWTFEVRRVGKPRDPKTRYSILPEDRIDEATRKRIAASPQNDLIFLCRNPPADAAIDLRIAAEIARQLELLSPSSVDSFMATFRVKRVRDLRVVDLAKVGDFLAAQAAEHLEPTFDQA